MGLFSKKEKAPFQGALFDLNGTLFDTERWFMQAWWNVLARRGLRHQDYDPEWHSGLMSPAYIGVVMHRFGIEESSEDFGDEWRREAHGLVRANAKLQPGARRLLKDVKKLGVRMAIVTSSSMEMTDFLLDKNGLLGMFWFKLTKDFMDLHSLRGKPAPDPYFAAAHMIEVHASRCIAFEDSVNGLVSAKTAGCRTVVGVVNFPDSRASEIHAKRGILQSYGANLTFTSFDRFRINEYLHAL